MKKALFVRLVHTDLSQASWQASSYRPITLTWRSHFPGTHSATQGWNPQNLTRRARAYRLHMITFRTTFPPYVLNFLKCALFPLSHLDVCVITRPHHQCTGKEEQRARDRVLGWQMRQVWQRVPPSTMQHGAASRLEMMMHCCQQHEQRRWWCYDVRGHNGNSHHHPRYDCVVVT